MYKNPQASDAARQLKDTFKQLGVEVPLTKAAEALARMEGYRTLHVAQAKNNAGVKIADVAKAQAQAVMFERLGRFEGKLDTLLEELRTLKFLTDAREVDALFGSIFRTNDAPVLAPGYEGLTAEEIPDAFQALSERLKKVLVDKAKAPEVQEPSPLYEGPMLDWMMGEGLPDSEITEKSRKARYRVVVERSGSQLYVNIAPAHTNPDELEGKNQMALFIEVNEGLPCVHLSNALYGDMALSVFASSEGLYLREGDLDARLHTGVLSESTHPQLAELLKENASGYVLLCAA